MGGVAGGEGTAGEPRWHPRAALPAVHAHQWQVVQVILDGIRLVLSETVPLRAAVRQQEGCGFDSVPDGLAEGSLHVLLVSRFSSFLHACKVDWKLLVCLSENVCVHVVLE